jgi:hypothetical protein
MVWIELIWLRIGTSGGFLWARYWTFGFHKMLRSSWVAEQLADSHWLCSMEFRLLKWDISVTTRLSYSKIENDQVDRPCKFRVGTSFKHEVRGVIISLCNRCVWAHIKIRYISVLYYSPTKCGLSRNCTVPLLVFHWQDLHTSRAPAQRVTRQVPVKCNTT